LPIKRNGVRDSAFEPLAFVLAKERGHGIRVNGLLYRRR